MASILKIDVLQERYANTGILLSGQINGPLGEIITREGRLKLPNEFAINSLSITNDFAANTVATNTIFLGNGTLEYDAANSSLKVNNSALALQSDLVATIDSLSEFNANTVIANSVNTFTIYLNGGVIKYDSANTLLTVDENPIAYLSNVTSLVLDDLVDVNATASANQVLTADGNGSFYFAAASDPITVQKTNTTNAILSTVTNVNDFRFDEDSGFDIVDLGSGAVKIQMNSTFKTWKVDGQDDLVATGLDTIELVAGDGITLTTNANGSPYKTITFTGANTLTDLNISDGVANQVLTTDGTGNFFFADAATELKELTDVNSTATANQVLTADGSGNFFFANNAAEEITTLTDIGIADGEADQVLTTDGNGTFFFGHTLSILNQDLISGGEITELRDCRTVIDLGTVDTRLGYAAPEGSKTVLLANDSTIVSSSSVSIISEENSIVKLNNIHLLSDVNFDAIANNSISGNKIYGGLLSADTANIGNNAFVVDSSGNVGIGTSPASELNVFHTTDPEIRLTISTHGDAGVLLGDADGLKIYGKGASNQLRFYTGISERMRIDSSGNVIIGSYPVIDRISRSSGNPLYGLVDKLLTISDSTNIAGHRVGIAFGPAQRVGSGIFANNISDTGSNEDTNLEFYTTQEGQLNARLAMTIDSSGRVGIGTNSPSYNIDVKGSTGISAQRATDTDRLIMQFDGFISYAPSAGAYNNIKFISQNNSGSVERMRIDSSGYVTMPYQPAFSSYKNGSQYPVSGSRDVITSWTSQLNIGGHFNNSTGVFTAPVSGTYFFYVSIMSDRNDSGDYQISIHKNGGMYVNSNDLHTANAIYVQTTVPCVIYVPQNDTVDFRLYNSTGTDTFIYSGNYSHCGGYLIG